MAEGTEAEDGHSLQDPLVVLVGTPPEGFLERAGGLGWQGLRGGPGLQVLPPGKVLFIVGGLAEVEPCLKTLGRGPSVLLWLTEQLEWPVLAGPVPRVLCRVRGDLEPAWVTQALESRLLALEHPRAEAWRPAITASVPVSQAETVSRPPQNTRTVSRVRPAGGPRRGAALRGKRPGRSRH